jgi:DNA-directed RNA polymerase specialized sigma24 family protein
VSTRRESSKRLLGDREGAGGEGRLEPIEAVALIARSRRELLLAAHRYRLPREDLEDCYSQATIELLTYTRRGGRFAGRAHIANILEQRLVSRAHDRRRALSGRSPMEAAIANALPLAASSGGANELVDGRADVERLILLRHDLRLIAQMSRRLSSDQRLVLASQLSSEPDCGEFCRAHGWSTEKYRKVAQRARARLARLVESQVEAPSRDCPKPPVPFARAGRNREQGQAYDLHSPNK